MDKSNANTVPLDSLMPQTGTIPDKPPSNNTLEKIPAETSLAIQVRTPHPLETKKGLPDWGAAFLAILPEVNGNLVSASEAIGRTLSAICLARNEYPALAKGISDIKAVVDTDRLERLEARSAKLADDDKNTTERIFQLNALRPERYRPRAGGSQVTAISINVGVQVPKAPDFSAPIPEPAKEL